VLAKVALGQADAGFVYSTDARTVRGRVRTIALPAAAQPGVTYAIAVVARSHRRAAAKAYVRSLIGKAGQAVLARYGFLPLAGRAEKKAKR
jgi:molybdate transport system substrate-binding protein